MTEGGPVQNTDRELYREPDKGCGDFYSDSIHVTQGGGIGINCGGHVIVKPLQAWHDLAKLAEDGFVAVPKEPTQEMLVAAYKAAGIPPTPMFANAYRAMIGNGEFMEGSKK